MRPLQEESTHQALSAAALLSSSGHDRARKNLAILHTTCKKFSHGAYCVPHVTGAWWVWEVD